MRRQSPQLVERLPSLTCGARRGACRSWLQRPAANDAAEQAFGRLKLRGATVRDWKSFQGALDAALLSAAHPG